MISLRLTDMGCRHCTKSAHHAMYLLLLLFLTVSVPAAGQGLFPPVSIGDNLARGQSTVATSTCEGGEFCGPSTSTAAGVCEPETCNSTCPHRPPPEEAVHLLETETTRQMGSSGPTVLTFNGSSTSASFATITHATPLLSDPGFTFTAWVQQAIDNAGYLLAKTSVDGQTQHVAIFVSSQNFSLLFHYLPRGLSSGFQTVSVSNVDLSANGSFHHLAVVVYRDYLSVFVDGVMVHREQLVAEVEDSSEGIILIGRRADGTSRFQGSIHSLKFYNTSLVDEQIRNQSGFGAPPILFPTCLCPLTHPSIAVHNTSLCISHSGANSLLRVNALGHAAALATDGHEKTWWQSANGVDEVNITVDFGDSRQVLYISTYFRSFTPYGMVIYYSEDGMQFSPRQYLAFDCEAVFELQRNGPLTSPTDVNCLSSYNIPERGRYVQFLLLDVHNRPGVQNYFKNSNLLQFSRARMVRLQLFGWHTYQGVQSDLSTQHFSLYELFISGEACLCNGHGSQCNDLSCVCQHNTMGASCSSCLPLYNNRPWAEGTTSSANECELCDCNQHASACIYDAELGAGRCLDCRDNTMGANCQMCVPFYYHPAGVPLDPSDTCQPCEFPGNITDDGRGMVHFVEEQAPILLTPAITISDSNSLSLSLLTIRILNSDLTPSIHLDQLTIYVPSTTAATVSVQNAGRTLEVTGSLSPPEATAVLQTLTFSNIEDEPSNDTRVVEILVSFGTCTITAARVSVTVGLVNDKPPVVDLDSTDGSGILGFMTHFLEEGPSVRIAGSVSVTDQDRGSLFMQRAELVLLNVQDGLQEGLMIQPSIPPLSVQVQYDSNNHALNLIGPAVFEDFVDAIQLVEYYNNANEPGSNPPVRVVNVTCYDGSLASTANSTISLMYQNDPPFLDLGGNIDTEVHFQEGAGPVSLLMQPSLMLSDSDNSDIWSATVHLSTAPDGDSERIDVNVSGSDLIAVSQVGGHLIILTGPVPILQLVAVIQTLTYNNLSPNPVSQRRQVDIVVSNGQTNSSVATVYIAFSIVNDPPVVDLNGQAIGRDFETVFLEGDSEVSVAGASASVTDIDSEVVDSIIAVLKNPLDGNLEGLRVRNGTTVGAIKTSYSSVNGTFTATGPATPGEFSQLLGSIVYFNMADEPSPSAREISFTADDGEASSVVGAMTTVMVQAVDNSLQQSNGVQMISVELLSLLLICFFGWLILNPL